jgi:hypothetical protein
VTQFASVSIKGAAMPCKQALDVLTERRWLRGASSATVDIDQMAMWRARSVRDVWIGGATSTARYWYSAPNVPERTIHSTGRSGGLVGSREDRFTNVRVATIGLPRIGTRAMLASCLLFSLSSCGASCIEGGNGDHVSGLKGRIPSGGHARGHALCLPAFHRNLMRHQPRALAALVPCLPAQAK